MFEAASYSPDVVRILDFGDGGRRPMPLVMSGCTSEDARDMLARSGARSLFPDAFAPEAALAGLWLYFGCFNESHSISQDIPTAEGSYWHGILHRQEPDAGNAGYWFRRAGRHAIFPALLAEARRILENAGNAVAFRPGAEWDALSFIDFCESARRRPASKDERVAQEIQLIEWQLLFDYCAQPRR